MGLFGSELKVTDGFSKTYSLFASETRKAKSDIDGLKSSIKDTESATGSAFGSMKSQAMSLASEYRKLGLTQSEALKKAWSEIERTSKNSSKNVGNDWKSSFDGIGKSADNLLSKVTKLAAGYLSLKGVIGGLKATINDASNFQNASVFLNAVYGDQQGRQKYKWATNEANNTPFSENEVASGLARAHSLNLKDDAKSFKMYEDLGSFAKIQGVGDLSSAIDAISDMQGGEWERLQTITGIKRAQLEDFANQNGIGAFTNKKGQVTDPEKAMEALQAYMDKKGISGMTDKFSKTFSGRMSTLKGNVEKTLAEMAGIQDDGTIKDGSLFDNASKGLEKLINSVNKFSKSESFDKISDGLGRLGNSIINGLDYVTEHPEIADTIVKVGGALIGLKVASSVISPVAGLVKVIGTLGSVSKASTLTNAAATGLNSSIVGMAGKTALLATGIGLLGAKTIDTDSYIHKFWSDTLGRIPVWGDTIKQGFDEDCLFIEAGFHNMMKTIKGFFGMDTGNEEAAIQRDKTKYAMMDPENASKIKSDADVDNWYTGKYGKTQNGKITWNTIPSMISNGSVTKNTSNSNINNNYKTDVHLSVGTVRETADVDDIANQLATKLNKVQSTRNAIGYY